MEPVNWKRVAAFGFGGFAAAAACWFLLRGLTGVFDVRNLRVFVGVIALLPAVLAPIYGFNPKTLTSAENAVTVPPAVCAASAACTVAAILVGEAAASVLRSAPIPWDIFNICFLFVAVVLPFQINRVFRKT